MNPVWLSMIILARSGNLRTSGTYASLVDAMRLCSLLSSWLDVLPRGIIGTCFYKKGSSGEKAKKCWGSMQIDVDKGSVDQGRNWIVVMH